MVKQLHELFQMFDRNGDGRIDRPQLELVLTTLDSRWTEERLDSLFKVVDVEGRGSIDYSEFMAWAFGEMQCPVNPGAASSAEKPIEEVDISGSALGSAAENPAVAEALGVAEAAAQAPASSSNDDAHRAYSQGVRRPKEKTHGRQLADGVDLFTQKDAQNFAFNYSVHNGKMSMLVFTLDASGSTNMGCAAWPERTKVTVEVPPDEHMDLGTICRLDPKKASSVKVQYSWSYKPLDRQALKAADEAHLNQLRSHAQALRANNITASSLGSAAAISHALAAAGLDHFIDLEFFPDDAALYDNPEDERGAPVVWRRPKDFMDGGIAVFADGITPCDIRQGTLGDCWYLASLSALAEYPDVIKRRFATQTSNDWGIYEIRCFKNGKPTTVIVDDYFPCNPVTGKPCYSRAKGGELWPMLLEKAWAKLHGCYEQIEGGVPMHAIVDLCGGIGKVYNFSKEQEMLNSGEFWEMMKYCDEYKFFMVAGTPGHDNMTKQADDGDRPSGGIVPGHAYTVIGVKEAEGVRLVNLRNPWGEFEWEGAWSDDSPLWTPAMKRAFKPHLDAKDGQFWMCEADFYRSFNDLSLVYYGGHVGREFSVSRTELFTPAEAFCSQLFVFDVDAPALGSLALIQRDVRVRGTPQYTEMALAVYGPCSGPGGLPAREVFRSNPCATRDLVESIPITSPLEKGRYVVAVFNPTMRADVPVVLVVELVAVGPNGQFTTHTRADVPTGFLALTDATRRELVLCTAVNSANSEVRDFNAFEISGTWMPHGGYAVAARNKGGEALNMSFDFSSCKGLQIYGVQGSSLDMVLRASEKMQLVAEFLPTGGAKSFGYRVSYTKKQ